MFEGEEVLKGREYGYEVGGENVVVEEPGEEEVGMGGEDVIVVDIKGPVRSLGNVRIRYSCPVSTFAQQQPAFPGLSIIAGKKRGQVPATGPIDKILAVLDQQDLAGLQSSRHALRIGMRECS